MCSDSVNCSDWSSWKGTRRSWFQLVGLNCPCPQIRTHLQIIIYHIHVPNKLWDRYPSLRLWLLHTAYINILPCLSMHYIWPTKLIACTYASSTTKGVSYTHTHNNYANLTGCVRPSSASPVPFTPLLWARAKRSVHWVSKGRHLRWVCSWGHCRWW